MSVPEVWLATTPPDSVASAVVPRVYMEATWVPAMATVPLTSGIEAVCRFAERAWRKCLTIQMAGVQADRKLGLAEDALLRIADLGLTKDGALALAAVQSARALLYVALGLFLGSADVIMGSHWN